MLCQFSFQNFKSYRDETVFDLQATAIPEFKDNLIVKDKCSDSFACECYLWTKWRRKDEFDPSVILSYYNSGETDS